MKKELLTQLIEKTFAKLAAPAPGTGLYAELKSVIHQAFELGALQQAEDSSEDMYTGNLFAQQHSTENNGQHATATA